MAPANRCSATHRVTPRGARRSSADARICPPVAPTTRAPGLPPCNDALLPTVRRASAELQPRHGRAVPAARSGIPGRGGFRGPGPISVRHVTRIRQRRQARDRLTTVPLSPTAATPGEPAGYSGAAVCGNDPVAGLIETRPACIGNTGRLFDPTRLVEWPTARHRVTSLRKPSHRPGLSRQLRRRRSRDQPGGPGAVESRATTCAIRTWPPRWARRCSGTCSSAATACRPARRATSPRAPTTALRNQLNPEPPGRRHAHSSSSATATCDTAEVAADQDVNRDLCDRRLPDASPAPTRAIPGEPLLNPGNNIARHQRCRRLDGRAPARLHRHPDAGHRRVRRRRTAACSALLPDIGTVITDEIPLYRKQASRRAAQHADDDQLGVLLRQFLGRPRAPRLQRRQRVRRGRSAERTCSSTQGGALRSHAADDPLLEHRLADHRARRCRTSRCPSAAAAGRRSARSCCRATAPLRARTSRRSRTNSFRPATACSGRSPTRAARAAARSGARPRPDARACA